MPDVRLPKDTVPTSLLALAFILITGLGVTILFRFGRASEMRAPEEIGLSPVYSDRGGGTFGLRRVSAPFVRVSVYPAFIVIAHCRTYVLPALAVRDASLVRALIGRRVRLVHGSSALPSPLTLWSRTPEALLAAIHTVAPHSKPAA